MLLATIDWTRHELWIGLMMGLALGGLLQRLQARRAGAARAPDEV